MKIAIHAGHNADGHNACGAVGFVKESTECRKIVKKVIELLKSDGHKVYDCTVDNAKNQSNNLNQIMSKSNSVNADLVVSVHLNALKKSKKDGKNKGTEVWIYSYNSKAKDEATQVCINLSKLGFTNRGVKISKTLYVLRKAKVPAMLIETFFCDDEDDYILYKNIGVDKIAKAIAEGIVGHEISEKSEETNTESSISAGKKLSLKNVPCYPTASSKTESSKKTGTFYVWSSEVVSGRIRITTTKDRVGKAGQVTGWIDKKYA